MNCTNCMGVIGPTVLQLVNESLRDSKVPDSFKLSTVSMVPKFTRSRTVEDFRPINMLITLEKLLESMVKEELREYIKINRSRYTSRHTVNFILARRH